jgi:hypothetical protein
MKIIFLIMVTIMLNANEPICEIYNIDKDRCELLEDQNLTLNKEWAEFY